MLNEQEMQFADPDWKPTGPLSTQPTGPLLTQQTNTVANAPLSASAPGSGNGQAYDASQFADLPAYGQGYQGAWQGQQPAFQQFSGPQSATRQAPYQAGMQRRRGGSRWWIWVIIVIICVSLASGVFHSSSHSYPDFKKPGFSQPRPAPDKQVFDLHGATQLNINDLSGNITVQVNNGDDQSVIVGTDDGSQAQVNYQGLSMGLTSTGNGAITVFVPQSVALNLSAGENNIEVDGFSGQLSAQTGSGQITLNGDNLSQGSVLNTNSGNINLGQQGSVSDTSIISSSGAIFLDQTNLSGTVTVSTGGNGTISYNGALDPRGKYQFTTDSGNIDLTFPQSTSMQLKTSQKSGHYSSTFPSSSGSAPQAAVGVTTNSGDITIIGQ